MKKVLSLFIVFPALLFALSASAFVQPAQVFRSFAPLVPQQEKPVVNFEAGMYYYITNESAGERNALDYYQLNGVWTLGFTPISKIQKPQDGMPQSKGQLWRVVEVSKAQTGHTNYKMINDLNGTHKVLTGDVSGWVQMTDEWGADAAGEVWTFKRYKDGWMKITNENFEIQKAERTQLFWLAKHSMLNVLEFDGTQYPNSGFYFQAAGTGDQIRARTKRMQDKLAARDRANAGGGSTPATPSTTALPAIDFDMKNYVRIVSREFPQGYALEHTVGSHDQVKITSINTAQQPGWNTEAKVGQYWRLQPVGRGVNVYRLVTDLNSVPHSLRVGSNYSIKMGEMTERDLEEQLWVVTRQANGYYQIKSKYYSDRDGSAICLFYLSSEKRMMLADYVAGKTINGDWYFPTITNERAMVPEGELRTGRYRIKNTMGHPLVMGDYDASYSTQRESIEATATYLKIVQGQQGTEFEFRRQPDGTYIITFEFQQRLYALNSFYGCREVEGSKDLTNRAEYKFRVIREGGLYMIYSGNRGLDVSNGQLEGKDFQRYDGQKLIISQR